MKLICIMLLSAMSVSAAGAEPAQDEQSPASKIYNYTEEDGKAREIEVYFPKEHDAGKTKVPGIIMFHGGAWRPPLTPSMNCTAKDTDIACKDPCR